MKILCTPGKRFLNFRIFAISYRFPGLSSRKIAAADAAANLAVLLLPERLAIGALILGGVGFVGAHQNPVQGAVILAVAVIGTLRYGAFNTLVGMIVHGYCLLCLDFSASMHRRKKIIQEKPACDCNFGRNMIS